MKNITVLIVGHVTKEGNLAGPRSLGHMWWMWCCTLEGDRSYQFRAPYGKEPLWTHIRNRTFHYEGRRTYGD